MKRHFFLLLLAMVLGCSTQARKMFELPVWNVAEQTDDRADARLYVHLADRPTGQVIIVCPGGGYEFLSMDSEGHAFAPWLNQYGISVVVLKYRMPRGRSEVPLSDLEQAMRVVRSHQKDWHINPANVGVMGFSAGGHLVSTLATHFSSPATRPDFHILFYPVVTMNPAYTHMGTHNALLGAEATKEQEKEYSNELHVTDQTPRAFLISCAGDAAVPIINTAAYMQALVDHKVPVSTHIYPTGYHGFGFDRNYKDSEAWQAELIRWLKMDGK